MQRLDVLVGRWQVAMHGAWFLPNPDIEDAGMAVVEWWSDAFVTFRWRPDDGPDSSDMQMVFGHSSATDRYHALYHDERGMDRLFAMTFDGATWTLLREDDDFYQRWTAEVSADRISGLWQASDDRGETWRTDYELILERRA